jgi:hypothetical protein
MGLAIVLLCGHNCVLHGYMVRAVFIRGHQSDCELVLADVHGSVHSCKVMYSNLIYDVGLTRVKIRRFILKRLKLVAIKASRYQRTTSGSAVRAGERVPRSQL